MLVPAFRPRAFHDLESVTIYLGEALGMPQKAREWYTQIMEAVDLLCEFPDLGRPFNDEMLRIEGMRTYRVNKHRLFYSHDAETLTVWRVVHTSQDLDDFALIDLRD